MSKPIGAFIMLFVSCFLMLTISTTAQAQNQIPNPSGPNKYSTDVAQGQKVGARSYNLEQTSDFRYEIEVGLYGSPDLSRFKNLFDIGQLRKEKASGSSHRVLLGPFNSGNVDVALSTVQSRGYSSAVKLHIPKDVRSVINYETVVSFNNNAGGLNNMANTGNANTGTRATSNATAPQTYSHNTNTTATSLPGYTPVTPTYINTQSSRPYSSVTQHTQTQTQAPQQVATHSNTQTRPQVHSVQTRPTPRPTQRTGGASQATNNGQVYTQPEYYTSGHTATGGAYQQSHYPNSSSYILHHADAAPDTYYTTFAAPPANYVKPDVIYTQPAKPATYSHQGTYLQPVANRTAVANAHLNIAPNNVTQEIEVSVSSPVQQPINVILYNASGVPVAELFNGVAAANQRYAKLINASLLTSGNYIIQLVGENKQPITRNLTITR